MNTNRTSFGIACRAAAFCFLLAGTASVLPAQQSSSATSAPGVPLFLAAESAPLNLSATSSSSSSSSSSSLDAAAEDRLDLSLSALDSSQPPPRRRYGRPNYSSGANKWTGVLGAGLTSPIGDTHFWETPSYGLEFGFGRAFNEKAAVLLQFDYDHFGLQGATVANQQYIYNYCTHAEFLAEECAPEGPAPSGTASQIGGSNHVWSFTLDPTFTLPTEGSLGAYAVVGGGFYHKVTTFTTPTNEPYCYYYCEEVTVNAPFDHYTSNAVGGNIGLGLTWKFSKFSSEKLFAEARYVIIDNAARSGVTVQNVDSSPLNAADLYPANSHHTTYIPIKVGIRF